MFRLHLLVEALDLPDLLDAADEMDEAVEAGLSPLTPFFEDDEGEFKLSLSNRYQDGHEVVIDE